MLSRDERKAAFAAMAAAYHAKSGTLDDVGVLWLETRCKELVPDGGEVRDMVEQFVEARRHVRRDPEAVAALADKLLDRLKRLIRPDVPGSDRKDIHG